MDRQLYVPYLFDAVYSARPLSPPSVCQYLFDYLSPRRTVYYDPYHYCYNLGYEKNPNHQENRAIIFFSDFGHRQAVRTINTWISSRS